MRLKHFNQKNKNEENHKKFFHKLSVFHAKHWQHREKTNKQTNK